MVLGRLWTARKSLNFCFAPNGKVPGNVGFGAGVLEVAWVQKFPGNSGMGAALKLYSEAPIQRLDWKWDFHCICRKIPRKVWHREGVQTWCTGAKCIDFDGSPKFENLNFSKFGNRKMRFL